MSLSSPHPRTNPVALSLSLTLLASLPLTNAYTWSFASPPKQCTDLTINVSGSDGKPPFRVLFIPFGASPLSGNVEVRRIMDVPLGEGSWSTTVKMAFPGDSQFVAVVSDASGFGSGGTSVAVQVAASSDSSCFDSTKSVTPYYYFNIEPQNQIVQCQNTRIWWDPSTVTGNTVFQGVIPGGQSFWIPQDSLTQVNGQGTGFDWKPSLRTGTTVMLVGGDGRGNGTAGSIFNVVSAGVNPDTSCLNENSPSSTPGSPAGGSYPTDRSGNGTGGGSGSGGGKSNTGAIVGGVIGGVALFVLALLAFWVWRRRARKGKKAKERPDLLNADDEDDEHDGGRRGRPNELPQYYQPEPFMVPDPTLASGRESHDHDGTVLSGHGSDERRPLSGMTFPDSFYTRATTPDASSHGDHMSAGGGGGGTGASGTGISASAAGRRKGGALRPMRPVNIIQHDDAGPSGPPPPPEEGEPETIELPPAYTALRAGGAGGKEGAGAASTVDNAQGGSSSAQA